MLRIQLAALLLLPALAAFAQGIKAQSTNDKAVYSNIKLGFRYTPPAGMSDTTAPSKQEIRAHASSARTSNTLGLLLGMSSGPDDTAPSWRSISIETYSRAAVSVLDDNSAEAQMTAWVAGRRSLDSPPHSVVLSGRNFAVAELEHHEGTITKYAAIYTTLRKGELLSFALGANSREQLKVLTESMTSIQFF
jgi:hypothetical protein